MKNYFKNKNFFPVATFGLILVVAVLSVLLFLSRKPKESIFIQLSNLDSSSLTDGIKKNGYLRLKNGHLVNQEGKPIQLQGLSSHGLIWYPQYINYRALLDLRNRGANILRAAMYADSIYEGYNENEITKRLNLSLIYLAIENALATDMYVIVDWHLLLDKNPLFTVKAAMEFFNEISSRYPNHPGLLYEICNEPNGGTSWDEIREYANKVIPVIRQNSPKAIILVGTPEYSTDILSVRSSQLDYDNVMYTLHVYFDGQSGIDYQERIERMTEAGLGVFITEWGIGPTLGNSENTSLIQNFIDYCRKHKISWTNWSLSNKDENFSVIKPDCFKLSGWTDEDLTFSGRMVFQALGHNPVN
jgi:aryl-phospho-beta-D-glucosidase BglC (GH1 family)